MKYFAILKDSLREAWDSWVLLVLLVLSTLVIFIVGSLSFKPLSAQQTMGYFFSQQGFEPPVMLTALNNRRPAKILGRQGHWRSFTLHGVEVVRGDADSPLSDYALTVASGGRRFGGGDPLMPPMEVKAELKQPAVEPKAELKQPAVEPKVEPKKPAVDLKAEMAQLRKLFDDAEEFNYVKIGTIEPILKGEEDKGPQQYRVIVQGTPDTHRIWATEPSLVFGAVPLAFLEAPLAWRLYNLAHYLISFGSWIAVLLGIVITSFFIPNMLRKGTVDLLLAKPISRWLLLTYKYLGGLAFIFLTTTYAIGGIWLVLGLRSGLWANGALLVIPTLTFFFAILYAVSTFIGVVTRSVVTCIMLTIGAYATFAGIGLGHWVVELVELMEKEEDRMTEEMGRPEKPAEKRWTGHWALTTVNVIYAISPRTEDLNDINDLVVYTDFMTGNLGDMSKFDNAKRNWWEGFLVSSIWIGIFLGLSMFRFYFKDY